MKMLEMRTQTETKIPETNEMKFLLSFQMKSNFTRKGRIQTANFLQFFAVWTVHHDCDRSHFIARTIRNPLKSFVTYDMFYHVEHHLFPTVPTCKLGELSSRLDAVAPELRNKLVF